MLGGAPTPVSWPEVYTSLATGVVEGTKNGITDITNMKFQEHLRYMTKACPQSLPHYVIEKQDLSVSSPMSTDGASIIRQQPPGSRAPLCG